MQKIRKAAEQLGKREIAKMLKNLKSNQIVINNYGDFCELYEKAVECEECEVIPFFRDGTILVKNTIENNNAYFLINFFSTITQDSHKKVELQAARIEFSERKIINDEDFPNVAVKKLYSNQKNWLFSYVGEVELEYTEKLNFHIKKMENAITRVISERGQLTDPFAYVNSLPDSETIKSNFRSCIDLYTGIMICIDYLLKHPEEKKRSERKKKDSEQKKPILKKEKTEKIFDEVQTFSLNSLKFRTSNKKAATALKSRKFQRYAECWNVRGHYRHYRSGKTVYIESYTKGAGRAPNKPVKKYTL